MSPLSRRSSRVVWIWCIAYTAVAAPTSRERRRGELRSHLWESEHAAMPAARIALAALRGVVSDLNWALSSGIPRLARSFGTPTPYIVLLALRWRLNVMSLPKSASGDESIVVNMGHRETPST